MGSLSGFFKAPGVTPLRFPRGTFTMGRGGEIVTSTLPRSFPAAHAEKIGRFVLSALRSAAELGVPLTDVTLQFDGVHIHARDLSGGAIVYLKPQEF